MTTRSTKSQSPGNQDKSQSTVQPGQVKDRRKLGPVKDMNNQSLSIAPGVIQKKSADGKSDNKNTGVPNIVREELKSPGQPLDRATRNFMEKRFGHDFSRVRVHSGERAAESSRSIGALAYTAGNNIVFGSGQYSPGKPARSALMAHELAHTIQQASPGPNPDNISLGSSSNFSEQAADESARIATQQGLEQQSAALRIRNQLRQTQGNAMIQRVVETWAGKYDTDKYENVQNAAGDNIGVSIELRFKPGDPVDATMIGMAQMVTSRDLGATVALNPTVGARSIPAGQTGEGAHIDQYAENRNPLYAAGAAGAADRLWTTATESDFGQHGYHHVDSSGVLHTKDAILKDEPSLDGRGANASQIFESTALAVTGNQTGAYYGSVQWGWRTDAAGKFSRLPLTRKSNDVPSATFVRAQGIWNKTPTSDGESPIKFYSALGRYVNADDASLVSNPKDAAGSELGKLPKNVRVEVINKGIHEDFNKADPANQWWRITPVEGTFIGRVGWIMAATLSKTKV